MFLTSPSQQMTVEAQQWVMCPTGENGAYKAEAVYAPSPEVAVEEMRKLFVVGDYGERLPPDTNIRLAEGVELPWNDPATEVYVVEGGDRRALSFASETETRETYDFLYEGKPYTVRRATPAEIEQSMRAQQVEQDQEDQEQFDYGFNVLYHQMRDEEEGL